MILEALAWAVNSAILVVVFGFVFKFSEDAWAWLVAGLRAVSFGSVLAFVIAAYSIDTSIEIDDAVVTFKRQLAKQTAAFGSIITIECTKNGIENPSQHCTNYRNLLLRMRYEWQALGFSGLTQIFVGPVPEGRTNYFGILKERQDNIQNIMRYKMNYYGDLNLHYEELISLYNKQSIENKLYKFFNSYWHIVLATALALQLVGDFMKLSISRLKKKKEAEKTPLPNT